MAASSLVVNDGKHIDHIVETTTCDTHAPAAGFACYTLPRGFSRGDWLIGVCGPRIKKAGYVGEISATALQQHKGGRGGKRERS